MIPCHDGKALGGLVIVKVGVVTGPIDIVEVVEELLNRKISGERINVEAVREFRFEVKIRRIVHELQEFDKWTDVFVPSFLAPCLAIGLWVGTSIGIVAGAVGFVQLSASTEPSFHPLLVRTFDDQAQDRRTAVHTQSN